MRIGSVFLIPGLISIWKTGIDFDPPIPKLLQHLIAPFRHNICQVILLSYVLLNIIELQLIVIKEDNKLIIAIPDGATWNTFLI